LALGREKELLEKLRARYCSSSTTHKKELRSKIKMTKENVASQMKNDSKSAEEFVKELNKVGLKKLQELKKNDR
jgi:hypothetical protein